MNVLSPPLSPPLSATPAAPSPPSRLVLSSRPGTTASDGAWWPRSTDLRVEVPLLDVAVNRLTRSRIARFGYERARWGPTPRKVHTPLGITHLGWFEDGVHPHHVTLSMSSYNRLVLTVIPPDMDEDTARGLLASAGTGRDGAGLASQARDSDRWADDGGTRQSAHHRR